MGGHNRTHGKSFTPVYAIWKQMRARCNNPTNDRYHRYGGRGIRVCRRWDSFEAFEQDMGPRPEGYTLERKHNDRNYTPSNCHWAPHSAQFRNRSTTRMLTDGVTTMCVTDWARRYGITRNAFNYRLIRGRYDGTLADC